jgi:hypothetical protein
MFRLRSNIFVNKVHMKTWYCLELRDINSHCDTLIPVYAHAMAERQIERSFIAHFVFFVGSEKKAIIYL